MTRLCAEAVCVQRRGARLLDGVSLEIAPGEALGLIGPNGAGKSTLLRVLAGLEVPGAGAVRLDGVPLQRIPPLRRARRIAYLPQSAERLPPLPVVELAGLGRLPWRHAGRDDDAAVANALARVDLDTMAARDAATLSGGEAARVRLARALATEAPLLLADEPIAALDPAHALRVMALLRSLAADGIGLCVVLHDLTLAARFCTRLALLDRGRLVAAGDAACVLSDANLQRVYRLEARRLDGAVVAWHALPPH